MHEFRLRLSPHPARRLHPRLFLLDLFALTLILLAPLLVLLSHHGYGYFAPEVLLIAAAALGAAVVLALLIAAAGQLARIAVLAFLLTVFIDLHTGQYRLSSLTVVIAFFSGMAGLGLLLWLLHEHATKIVSIIFVVLVGLTPLTAKPGFNTITNVQGPPGPRGGDAPLLIHLVLDEHIGVEGLPLEVPGARQLRSDLIDFYERRGFRLFGRAYSEYANTNNSLANLANFTAEQIGYPNLARGVEGAQPEWSLKKAAYFRELQRRGYQLHVYQSTYLNLCDAQGVRPQNCMTYPVASLRTIQDLRLLASEKARFIVTTLLSRSRVLHVVNKVYERVRPALAGVGWQLPIWSWNTPSFGPLGVPAVFELLTRDILANPRGHAFFAHVMAPHNPYVFDRRCTLRPRAADWLLNHIGSTDSLIYNTADSRTQRYERYFEQVRCVLTLVDGLLTTLDSHGLLGDATLIIHGDHGSRISEHFPSGRTLAGGVVTETDYVDTFSTLYAIKSPQTPPAYVGSPASIVKLLHHHLSRELLDEQSSCRVFVTAGDGSGALRVVEPKFCARGVATTFSSGED